MIDVNHRYNLRLKHINQITTSQAATERLSQQQNLLAILPKLNQHCISIHIAIFLAIISLQIVATEYLGKTNVPTTSARLKLCRNIESGR